MENTMKKLILAAAAVAAAGAFGASLEGGAISVKAELATRAFVRVVGYGGQPGREGFNEIPVEAGLAKPGSDVRFCLVQAADDRTRLVQSVVATFARTSVGWIDVAAPYSGDVTAGPRITSIRVTGSVPEMTVDADPAMGNVVILEGKTNLSDPEWAPAAKGHRFFRAVQRRDI